MPNNGRITICPYYKDEKNLSISCEDIFRRFRWPAQKEAWLDTYCDDKWRECPHAQELEKLYKKMGDCEVKNKYLQMQHKVKELEKEQRRTASMLGRLTKREKRKDDEIKQLKRDKQALESMWMNQRQSNDKLLKDNESLRKDFNELAEIYEARFAYLMSEFSGGTLDEQALAEWAAKYEYAIQADLMGEDIDGTPKVKTWKVITREISDEHGTEGPAAQNAGTGIEADSTAGCESEERTSAEEKETE